MDKADLLALDGDSFDPISFLNERFPTEHSLGAVDSPDGALSVLLRQASMTHTKLRRLVGDELALHAQQRTTAKLVQETRLTVQRLCARINAIRHRTVQSETLVDTICRDVRALDVAKRNLDATMHALKRLHMLLATVDQLERLAHTNNYRRLAQSITATEDVFKGFEGGEDVPKVRMLRQRCNDARRLVRSKAMEEFAGFSPKDTNSGDEGRFMRLHDACLVVDALGSDCKGELLEYISRHALNDYRNLFAPATGATLTEESESDATMNHAERRYAWFRRTLRAFHENWCSPFADAENGIFPRHWNVPGVLAMHFSRITHRHFSTLLKKGVDTPVLVRALQMTVAFETELQKLYHSPFRRLRAGELEDRNEEEPQSDLTAQANRIKEKYRQQKEAEFLEVSEKDEQKATMLNFAGVMSGAFRPYLQAFLDLEKSNIRVLCDDIENGESWNNFDGSKRRFDKCDALLKYMKKSLARCERIDKDQVMFDLVNTVYRGGFEQLLALLRLRIPPVTSSMAENTANVVLAVMICNTAEHIFDVLPGVAARANAALNKAYRKDGLFEDLCDKFGELTNHAAEAVVDAICEFARSELQALSSADWSAQVQAVGDASPYAVNICNLVELALSSASPLLSNAYHRFVLQRMASQLLDLWLGAVMKCNVPVSEMAAQQLLLDAHMLKVTLNRAPTLGVSAGRGARSYVELVSKRCSQIEAVLKTLATPLSQYCPHTFIHVALFRAYVTA
ncbi:MAG: hypothetical protein MHM6MM_004941 [Cercozoa sp. M6MM]